MANVLSWMLHNAITFFENTQRKVFIYLSILNCYGVHSSHHAELTPTHPMATAEYVTQLMDQLKKKIQKVSKDVIDFQSSS